MFIILTHYQRVTDRRTDRRTCRLWLSHSSVAENDYKMQAGRLE